MFFDQLYSLLLLLYAIILGGIVGAEREIERKPAGLRTQMLVAVASALFVRLSIHITEIYSDEMGGTIVRADPTRVFQAIAVGVAFIGAGTIIQNEQRHRVENLTTAASILVTSGIGIAVGMEMLILATGAAIGTFGVLYFLGQWEAYTLRTKKNVRSDY